MVMRFIFGAFWGWEGNEHCAQGNRRRVSWREDGGRRTLLLLRKSSYRLAQVLSIILRYGHCRASCSLVGGSLPIIHD